MNSNDSFAKNEQIIAILNGAELERAWKECLLAWEDSSPAQRADCRAFILHFRDNFLRIVRDVDDPYELETVAAIFYTQVKAQWILINTQSGYLLRSGKMDGSLFCRAGMLSALLGAIEPVMRENDLTRITNFLAEPDKDEVSEPELARLAALVGVPVHADMSADPTASNRVVVDAIALENRLLSLHNRLEDSEKDWNYLLQDLGLSERSDVILLFEKLLTESAVSGSKESLTNPALAEWGERKDQTLRNLRKEIGRLQQDWQAIYQETGASDVHNVVERWREMQRALVVSETKVTERQAALAAFLAEYGDKVTATDLIQELRDLSSKIASLQSQVDIVRTENEYLEREFGTFNAQQMVVLVRSLRDKISTLSAQSVRWESDQSLLKSALGTSSPESLILQVQELRDTINRSQQELAAFRDDRQLFQNELGKTNAREIIGHVHTMEKKIAEFSEMSELLGSMEEVLKTLNT